MRAAAAPRSTGGAPKAAAHGLPAAAWSVVPLPLTAQRWPADVEPRVTIRCTTYNHASFIGEAIESFLRQETTFPVQVLIHDDAPTDGTSEILRDYAAKYPQLISILIQPENTFRKPNRADYRWQLFRQTRGKYVAFCEGDDYWQDPRKLQIQADYLDRHPEVVMSGHDTIIVQADGTLASGSQVPPECRRDFTGDELKRGIGWLPMLSWMVRREPLHEDLPELSRVLNGDTFRTAALGRSGGSHYHSDIAPGAYRMHPGGVWSSRSERDRHLALANTAYWISEYFQRVGDPELAAWWAARYVRTVVAVSPTRVLLRALVSRSPVGRIVRAIRARGVRKASEL